MPEKTEAEEAAEITRVISVQSQEAKLKAILSMKDQLVRLKPEEILNAWLLTTAAGDNYCCAGCGPAYKGKSELGAVVNPPVNVR
jgi:hypothetical protein